MEITFKPAPLRAEQRWLLSGSNLTAPDGQQIDLTTITACHFTDLPAKRYWIATFKLVTPTGPIVISCNDTRAGIHRQYYFALIFELLDQFKVYNPDLAIQRGSGRLFNILFACIGIIPLGFGLKFIFQSIQNGLDPVGMGFGLFFLGMAAFIVWCASPWESPTVSTPKALHEWLLSWLKGMGTPNLAKSSTQSKIKQ